MLPSLHLPPEHHCQLPLAFDIPHMLAVPLTMPSDCFTGPKKDLHSGVDGGVVYVSLDC